jgi:hypothetical protein
MRHGPDLVQRLGTEGDQESLFATEVHTRISGAMGKEKPQLSAAIGVLLG